MEWITSPWYSWPFAIGAATLALVAIRWLWRNVVKPGWQFMKWVNRQLEIHETLGRVEPLLREIDESFKPNDGSSFYDCVMRVNDLALENSRRLEDIDGAIGEIRNLISVHLMDRRKGGRRNSDPA